MATAAGGARHPNILMIVADDLGYADLGCYGQCDFATPALDQLAREGVRYTHGYANSALCTNTRVALITGCWQYRFPIGLAEPLRHADRDDPAMALPASQPTLPGLLREAGYATALVGKWHLGALPLHGPLRSGYDSFFGISGGHAGYFSHLGEAGEPDLYEGETLVDEQGYLTHLLSDRAVDYVRRHGPSQQPFFLSLHYTAPHWPWSAPSQAEASLQRELRVKAKHLSHDGGSPTVYAEMVTEMDAGIGRVLQALEEAGAADDTLVIFTSDNGGERFSNMWPFVGRKRDLLEGGLRVPLIFRWPGRIAAGGVSTQVAISMDLATTSLAAAGASVPSSAPHDGMDLLPQLCGTAPEVERKLYWRMHDPDQRALRDGRWKYLRLGGREYLHDLLVDWRERTDYAAEQPERLAQMRADWERWSDGMLPMPTHVPSERLIDLASMHW
jgi:arylsulfatase A-like enzyme